MLADPFTVPLEGFIEDNNINVVSAYSAMQQTIQGFKELPKDTLKTFIYTGNAMLHLTVPLIMDLGLGKRATSFLIENALQVYKDEGFR